VGSGEGAVPLSPPHAVKTTRKPRLTPRRKGSGLAFCIEPRLVGKKAKGKT
jgi:hypothetical protein